MNRNTNSNLLKATHISTETVWPQSLPGPDEKRFFSITICEDSKLVWAIHEVDEVDHGVHTFKSQLKLNKDELKTSGKSEKLELLRTNLPKGPGNSNKYNVTDLQNFVCPVPIESTVEEDIIPAAEITLYIVGVNALEVDLLVRLFRCIPSRVFVMKSTDFFLPHERENLRLKVDRVAALRGSAHMHGFPAIIFDVGDGLTCTAANLNGRLIGESVSIGLWSRLQALIGINSDLRALTQDTVDKLFDEVMTSKKPLPLFANNNEKSAIATAMSELSNHARHLHAVWTKKVGSPELVGDGKRDPLTFCKVNYKRTGSVIGGEKRFLLTLLKENHGGLIEYPKKNNQRPNQSDEKIESISMIHIPELISRGIHSTILRFKHIIAEENESVLEEYVVAKSWRRPKPEITPLSSHTKSVKTKTSTKPSLKRKKSEKMSNGVHEETPENNLLERGKDGESLASTKKNSSKNKKNTIDKDKKIRKSEQNKRKLLKENKEISLFDNNPKRQVGKKTYKNFDGVCYAGEVVSFWVKPGELKDTTFWNVKYPSDDDDEDLTGRQLYDGLKKYAHIEKKMIDLS